MDTFSWIVLIIVIGSILGVFRESFTNYDFTWGDIWKVIKKVVMFIPYIILGIIFYVMDDFNNHRLGYVVLMCVIAFLGFGLYMGFRAGPASPEPW